MWLWLWELMLCRELSWQTGLWVGMAAPEHLPCLIQVALPPLANKSLCGHGMLEMGSMGWWRFSTQGMVRFALR